MTDPYQDDLRTLNHEAGHAVAAYLLGRPLLRITAHRHFAEDGERGRVEYLGRADDPLGEATILLAGRMAAEGIYVPGTTDDEQRARAIYPNVEHAMAETFILLASRAGRAALRALCVALRDGGYVLNGVEAERIMAQAVTEHVRR